MTTKRSEAEEGTRVELCAEGLRLVEDERLLPLMGGSIEYVHLPASAREKVLDAVSRLGLKVISASVPWSIHELAPASYAFEGACGRYQRDLGHFLEICKERGLFVWLRLGPAVGLELEGLGFPRRVLDERSLQARGPKGEPVIIALPPAAFAAPSYASGALLREAGAWLEAAAAQIAPYRYPQGPVVALSIDDKASLFYRTAAYDQDYHPDALEGFSRFVRARYGDDLPEVYGDQIEPPSRFDAESVHQLQPHLDWLDYKEEFLSTAMAHFVASARAGGLDGIPFLHGAAHAEVGQVISLTTLQKSFDGASYDLFAMRVDHIQRRRAIRRARGSSRSHVVGQLQWGAPTWWAPPSARAQCSEALGALMHGARGLILHSLMERDRWVDAPLSSDGLPAHAKRYDLTQRLIAAMDDLEVLERRERVEVALLCERRTGQLALLSSLVGPLSPLALSLLGVGSDELCDDRGLFAASGAARVFERSVEAALLARGLPFDFVEAEGDDELIGRYRALILPCAEIVDPALWPRLERYLAQGGALLVGPSRPRWNHPGGALDEASLPAHELVQDVSAALQALEELGIKAPPRPASPPVLSVVLHADPTRPCKKEGGVLFVANEEKEAIQSTLSGCDGRDCLFWDALEGKPLDGRLKLDAGAVRLLRCRPAGMPEKGGSP